LKWMLLGLVLALVLIGVGIGVWNPDNDRSHVSDNPEAIKLCDEGTAALQAFKLRDAVRILGNCLDLDPNLAEASISRAFAYARLGENKNYKMEMTRADSLTGQIEDTRRRMLAQLRLSGSHDSSYRALRDSILITLEAEIPENLFVLEAKATNAARTGTKDEVEQAWLRILELNPNYATSYNMLGYLELNRGNYDKAIEYMQKYAFLAPDLANPHDSLGEVYMVIGRYEEAEDEFRKSIDMQSDFYHSIINLGKVYLKRGQLEKGLQVLESVRGQVAGSNLEQRVDQEIIGTYLVSGLDEELGRTVASFISRYPKSEVSAVYRAISLAYMGKFHEGRAVMDSTLAEWRAGEGYMNYPDARASIDRTEAEFEAIAADVGHDHQSSEIHWARALELYTGKTPDHERWFTNYRYAAALQKNGKHREALTVVNDLLKVNNRLIPLLILKTQSHLELKEGEAARKTLQQLKWSLKKSDADFPARATADDLEMKISTMAMNN